MAYDERSFGFVRLTVTAGRLVGEFFAANPGHLARADAFSLDRRVHRVVSLHGDEPATT
jgi:hypothetical protein